MDLRTKFRTAPHVTEPHTPHCTCVSHTIPYIHTDIHAPIIQSTYIHSSIHCMLLLYRTHIHTYTPICINTYMLAYLHSLHSLHTFVPTFLHTYTPTYAHAYIRPHWYTPGHTYIPTYLDTHILAYLPTYVHTSYKHTCIQTITNLHTRKQT